MTEVGFSNDDEGIKALLSTFNMKVYYEENMHINMFNFWLKTLKDIVFISSFM